MFQFFHGSYPGLQKGLAAQTQQAGAYFSSHSQSPQAEVSKARIVCFGQKSPFVGLEFCGNCAHRLISGAKGNRRSPSQDWLHCKEIQPWVNWLYTQWAGYAFCCFLRCFSDLTGMFCSVWSLWATTLSVWRKVSDSAVCKHTSVVTPAFQLPLHTCQ